MSTTLAVGDKVPDAVLRYFNGDELVSVSTEDLFKGKKVVLFGLPGAFTPTCSKSHVPGFVEKAEEFKAKGVDTIACVSVNDAFVMKAWGETLGTGDKVLLLADGAALFTKAAGLDQDLTELGLGIRSKRYAAVIEDGIVKVINVEEGKTFTCSRADVIYDLV